MLHVPDALVWQFHVPLSVVTVRLKHAKFDAPVTVNVSPMSLTQNVPPLAATERKSGAAPCMVLNAVTVGISCTRVSLGITPIALIVEPSLQGRVPRLVAVPEA